MSTWVLLRGLAREARHWGELPGMLAAHGGGPVRVLAVDLPGNGELHGLPSPANVQDMVRALRRILAARGAAGPFHVMALSLGGMVALEWARMHAPEVARCVLLNTSLAGISPPWQRLRPRAWPALLRVLVSTDAVQSERAILAQTSHAPVDPVRLRQWVEFARERPVALSNALRQLAAAARYRAPAQAPCPVLLLASTHDRLVSVQCSRAIAAAWGCPVLEHPTAGHDLALDDPAWVVAAAIRGFPPA